MKLKFYLLPLLLFLYSQSKAQTCSALSFTYTTAESRCVATGSITVNVTGGSGNYNYKAIGPITTPVTSSNIITGLPAGTYSVIVKDINTNCTKQIDNIMVTGSYNDPRFQLTKTDVSCLGNDGTISVANQQYGRSPFTYTIVAPSPSNVGATSTTGNFTGLTPGEYAVQLQDSCGGIQVRRITIENYSWWFDSVSVVRNGCDIVDVFIRIKDSHGNVNTSGTAFNGFQYGYILNGDTFWYPVNAFSVILGNKRNLTLIVRDNCGNIHSTVWYLPAGQMPALNGVSYSNLACSTFTASIGGGYNLTEPYYCLYNASHTLISCDSSGSFSNLPYGSYCIEMTDVCYDTVITRCFTLNRPVPSVSPTVGISNLNCTTFTATISGQQNLSSPNYCLYNASNALVTCNTTGVFNNVPYGSYCIKTHDACTDSIITRCFTVSKPVPIVTGYSITGSNCSNFNVHVTGGGVVNPNYCLYDSLGNVVMCDSSGNFNGIPYGNYCVKAISCGDTSAPVCFNGSRPVPAVGPGVQIIEKKCLAFSVSVTGQTNLTNPDYCLYDANDTLITCNTTGTFYNIPYGSYCIKIHNTCFDTTILRCFTQLQPKPSLNTGMQLLGTTCTTVSFSANGGTNLTNPFYYLYNGSNSVLDSNSTGIFNNYPYGSYCIKVHDGCVDTTMQVCQTFTPVRGISLTTSKSCTINTTYVDVQFANSNAPYTIKAFHPNGTMVANVTTSTNPYRLQLPALPPTAQYKIVGIDNCGNKDSAYITPDANIVTKSTSVRGKCPSSIWQNGSGDILATVNSNYYGVTPVIIKKNGLLFNMNYSSVSSNTYTFSDLEPAVYIVEYTQATCNGKVYDTVNLAPYSFPTQGQSAVYQCDNNGFSLGADVVGGVSPYTFQIIGSLPDTPIIVTSPQSSAVFSINNGTVYSLIRLRTIDACGNATLSDVSVLPLQNFSVHASDSCFYQNISLSVDSIPNATYLWYKKTSPTDSVLIGSGAAYNLPFFVPEDVGLYVCKVIVNNGCLTRLTSFNLTGNCYGQVMPVAVHLDGRKIGNTNQLLWSSTSDRGILKFIIERKTAGEAGFTTIGTVLAHSSSNYVFNDNNFTKGSNQYRLKLVYASKTELTNVVILKTGVSEITVYPNPVKDVLSISITAERASDYQIDLVGASGQLVFTTEVKNVSSSTLTYPRDHKTGPGMYLLRITDKTAGKTEIRKLLFE